MMENISNENTKRIEISVNSDLEKDHLFLIRKNIYRFFYDKVLDEWGKVLEIGPMVQSTTPFKRYYIDTREELTISGNNYTSLDVVAMDGIDIPLDFTSYALAERDKYYDAIVALDVLEHVVDPWTWPLLMYKLLVPDGKLFLSTPFYFKVHGPLPDCWRFTKYGLYTLFHPYFDLEIEQINVDNDPNKPLHLTMVGTRYERSNL